ncbi:AAA family ATPase, partial [Microgenomates group bacterium]|nr:AAA family ATPase [Microgenomates group bacterium]
MNPQVKEKIISFLQDQISQAPFRTKAYVFDDEGKRNPTRNVFVRLKMYEKNFQQGQSEIRWLVITGLRGAGKTTLLAQLYNQTNTLNINKLFLSVDQVTQTFGVSLKDVLEVYEELLGTSFERLTEPVFIFLDEAQYDKNWAGLLKTIYDRSKKVFMVVTGSSALSLQSNPDVERRTIYEKLYPMSFTEYLKIKEGKFEVKGLSKRLKDIVFSSKTAMEVYKKLKDEETVARKYWLGIDRTEINKYIEYGTLPFMVALKNEALIYDQIKKTLDQVISVNMAKIAQFTPDVLSSFHMLLYI